MPKNYHPSSGFQSNKNPGSPAIVLGFEEYKRTAQYAAILATCPPEGVAWAAYHRGYRDGFAAAPMEVIVVPEPAAAIEPAGEDDG